MLHYSTRDSAFSKQPTKPPNQRSLVCSYVLLGTDHHIDLFPKVYNFCLIFLKLLNIYLSNSKTVSCEIRGSIFSDINVFVLDEGATSCTWEALWNLSIPWQPEVYIMENFIPQRKPKLISDIITCNVSFLQ